MNKIITILLVFVSCLAFGQGATPSLRASLVDFWKAENNDNGEKGHDGTSTDITYASGKRGNAFSLNGTSSFIGYSDSNDYSFTNGSGTDLPFSMSFWINPDDVSNNRPPASKYEDAQPEYFIIVRGSTSKLLVRLYSELTLSVHIQRESNTVMSTGSFQHYVVTYDGSESETGINIYRNGVLDNGTATETGTYAGMDNGTATFKIGRWDDNYYDGLEDEIKLYSRELKSIEAKMDYNSGNGLLYVYENFKNGYISFHEYLEYYLDYINYNS